MGQGPVIRNGKMVDVSWGPKQPFTERDYRMLQQEYNKLELKYEELKTQHKSVREAAVYRGHKLDELRLENRQLKAKLAEPSKQAALRAAEALAKNETEEWYRASDGVWRQKGVKEIKKETRGRKKKNYELPIQDDTL